MRMTRRFGALCLIVAAIMPTANDAAAADCGPGRFLAYGVNKFNTGPNRGGFSNQPGCANFKFHVNYAGSAVAEVQVVEDFPFCDFQTVQVMNGNFQNGPISAQSTPANQIKRQSLVAGNVLLGRFRRAAGLTQTLIEASWAYTGGCGSV